MWKKLNNEFSLWDQQKFNKASCTSWLQVVILTTEQLSMSNLGFFFLVCKNMLRAVFVAMCLKSPDTSLLRE